MCDSKHSSEPYSYGIRVCERTRVGILYILKEGGEEELTEEQEQGEGV